MTDILNIKDLGFEWDAILGKSTWHLDISEVRLQQGERVFLRGASGSGKSSLLSLICGITQPTRGEITVLGQSMTRARASHRDRIRADHMGVIFQMFNLIPYLSVVDNVTLPLRYSRKRRASLTGDKDAEAKRLLGRLGLEDPELLSRSVRKLSVGQQQRVAAARALIGGPELIIADEPTSALDTNARDKFIALLGEEANRAGSTLLFVSHDRALAPLFDRALDMEEINRGHA